MNRLLTLLRLILLLCATANTAAAADNGGKPFGWATCSDETGTAYTLDGGWHNAEPTFITLYASGDDDRQAILDAITNYDIVVLDGTKGDFQVSQIMRIYDLQNKSILGRNNARLCTQFYITPELKAYLDTQDLPAASSQSGTGGTLSNGVEVDEEREFKTRQAIIDFTGDTKELYRKAGIFEMNSNNENIIIRNVTFVGPGSVDVGGVDLVSNYGGNHVWIDHCEFIDGLDGNLDSGKREGSEQFVTYSWNVFHYTERTYSHPYSNGVGWNKGYLQYITYAYCHWGEGCKQRMPLADWVYIHLLNNYYTCTGNGYCIDIRANSHALIEGNYAIEGLKKPYVGSSYDDKFYLLRDNNGFGDWNEATNMDDPSSLEVPYDYEMLATDDVPSRVGMETGATLSNYFFLLPGEEAPDEPDPDDPDQPDPDDPDQPDPDNPDDPDTSFTLFALQEGDTFKAGQTLAFTNITLTFSEDGGADFKAAIASSLGEPYDEIFVAFTEGNDTNGNKTGGTFYVFRPAKDGTLTVGVVVNADKKLYMLEDDTAMEGFDGVTFDEKQRTTFDFTVKGGSTYKLYCAGSKLGFYGFRYEWVVEPEPAVIKGDANGQVTITDAVAVVDYILGNVSENFNEAAADVNNDGSINITDAVSIVDIILNSNK